MAIIFSYCQLQMQLNQTTLMHMNKQIKNVAEQIDAQDAVTLKYAQENFGKSEIDESKFVLKNEFKDLVKDAVIDLLKN